MLSQVGECALEGCSTVVVQQLWSNYNSTTTSISFFRVKVLHLTRHNVPVGHFRDATSVAGPRVWMLYQLTLNSCRHVSAFRRNSRLICLSFGIFLDFCHCSFSLFLTFIMFDFSHLVVQHR